jgi:hypothetical protein
MPLRVSDGYAGGGRRKRRSAMKDDQVLRDELLALLSGGNAHMSFDEAVADFPVEGINANVPNGSYTVWHVLEHMRIVQWDILEFVRNPNHVSPDFPGGYWPSTGEIGDPTSWKKSIRGFKADLDALKEIVNNPKTDFFRPIPHAREGYTVLREILLAADHNSFHIGEFVSIRRILGLNPVKEY